MRFGIMGMQTEVLVPPGLSPANAAAHLAGFDHAAYVRHIAAQGFKIVELGGDLTLFFPQSFGPEAIESLARVKQDLGLTYTVHLPLWSVEPSTPLDPVRQGSVRSLVEVIQATLPLEPAVYVLHATGPLAAEFYHMKLPATAHGLLMRMFQQQAAASIRTILAETGVPRQRLAIETIDYPFELTLELAAELDLSLCLDVGHVLAGFCGPIDLFAALEQCLPRLAEIHLHDAPWQGPEHQLRYGLDHQPLGRGDLDVRRLLDRLSQAGFDGPLILELMVDEALASLDTIRQLGPRYQA